jgi:cytoskeletal protein CcmA (bactofilin family)
MFSKKGTSEDKHKATTNNVNKEQEQTKIPGDVPKGTPARPSGTVARSSKVNKILKGSKMLGDINVTCDLEVSGDVDGNITSLQESNILIKGVCKGSIETKKGSVEIEGELQGGNITAGKDVKITGKFNGGEVRAAGKIFVNGEFNGKLEGDEVEIGANSSGKGEIFYKEYISISKGAKVEVQISQAKQSLKEIKTPLKPKEENSEPVQLNIEGEK